VTRSLLLWAVTTFVGLALWTGCGSSSPNGTNPSSNSGTPGSGSSGSSTTGSSTTGTSGLTPQEQANERFLIAVIPKGTTHVFWLSVWYGAEQAAKELGVDILWQGPLKEEDTDGQITVVQTMIAKKVDGIVLAPNNASALIPVVEQARAQKIPTVIFDSGLDDPEIIVSYVATDNFNGGALAAREMGRQLQGQGNVILLRYNQGSESTEQREEGFLHTLAKEFPNVKVLSSNQYAGTTPEEALSRSQDMLIQYGKQLNGAFTVCEPNTAGMLGALQNAGLAGKVKFIGFDPSESFTQAMRERKIHGIVLQDPVRMGYLAVKTMVEHLRGQPVPARINTGETIATPDNMEQPDIQKQLNPPIHK